MVFELVGVRASFSFMPCFFSVSTLPANALSLVRSCVGIFFEICFSLTPGGGRDSVTLVAGHSAAMRCWVASWDSCGTRMLE